jgi:hypothetical protein
MRHRQTRHGLSTQFRDNTISRRMMHLNEDVIKTIADAIRHRDGIHFSTLGEARRAIQNRLRVTYKSRFHC